MNLHSEINNMCSEIDNYFGNFGDPIATEFSFSPISTLFNYQNDDFILCGAGVGLIVNFAVYIDNNSYFNALDSVAFKDIQKALNSKLLAKFPEIEHALLASAKSENMFNQANKVVYDKLVKPRLAICNKPIKRDC